MLSYIGLVGASLAVIAYILLQSTEVNFQLKKFIGHDPDSVFRVLKDPNYLTDLHPLVRSIHVESRRIDAKNIEYHEFIVTEDVRHVGVFNYTATSMADPNRLEINTKAVVMHGLAHVNVTQRLTKAWEGSAVGTMVEVTAKMHFPYVLVGYCNRTAVEAHIQVLKNLEMLMEFVSGGENEDILVGDAE